MTKAEVLNYPVVGGLEGAKHETHLQCQINGDAPHFEADKHTGEPGFERDDGHIVGLFDVDKVNMWLSELTVAEGLKYLSMCAIILNPFPSNRDSLTKMSEIGGLT